MSKPDGGPAFPSPEVPMIAAGTYGMSLRDYFAGQALAGTLAGMCARWPAPDAREPSTFRARGLLSFADAAQDAYSIADAMLAERAKA